MKQSYDHLTNVLTVEEFRLHPNPRAYLIRLWNHRPDLRYLIKDYLPAKGLNKAELAKACKCKNS